MGERRVLAWDLVRRHSERPAVIAHRGASGYAPENTRAAYSLAITLGTGAVETDVHLSRDGVVVTIHDETVERTSNGAGQVDQMTFEDLQQLDFGSWYGAGFIGEPLPTLHDYFDALNGQAVACVEIKGGEGIEQRLVRILAQRDRSDDVVFFSFDAEAIVAMKQLLPEVPALFLLPWTEETIPCDPMQVERAVGLGMDAVGMDWQRLDRAVVETAHRQGLVVFAYTVNTREAVETCLAATVDCIISDVPDQVESWVSEHREGTHPNESKEEA